MTKRMNIVEDRADWLVDAIATSTQNRMFLRGDPEEDVVATEAILLCAKQALAHVEAAARARVAQLEAALQQSVNWQSHYAELLNMHDGGQRLTFANVEAWLDRLAALKGAPQ